MAGVLMMSGAPSGLKYPDGVGSEVERIGQQGDRMVSQLHGPMYELASRGRLFHAASQAATTTTIALATTYTGLCLSNPTGNLMNLEPRMIGWALSVAPAAEATTALGGGYLAAGVETHTTPLTTYNCLLGNAAAATGLADAACTLPAGPRVIMPLEGAFTAAALGLPGKGQPISGIVIPPGGYVFFYTLTVSVGFFGIFWSEFPV